MKSAMVRVVVGCVLSPIGLLSGCSPPWDVAGPVVAVTATGAHSPTQEIEQTYYVGIFDPQEQIPEAVYRIRVHGQGSLISQTRFASGWVPASLADSLGTSIGFGKDSGAIEFNGKDNATGGPITGRRLMMFGPEGFREAPKDHRLAIVMGSSPEKFFDAMSDGLATIAQVQAEARGSVATTLLLEELLRLRDERDRLGEVRDALGSAPSVAQSPSARSSNGSTP